MALLLTKLGKTELARSYFRDIQNQNDYYFFTFGKTTEWADESNPDTPVDSPSAANSFRRNILFAQQITAANTCHLVRRIQWENNTIYDRYDDTYHGLSEGDDGYENRSWRTAQILPDANYYVITSELNIYKCIDNRDANGDVVASDTEPTGVDLDIITAGDYKWKYMGTVTDGDAIRFLDSNWIPVRKLSGSNGQRFDVNGRIDTITLTNGGSGYVVAPGVSILGDGQGASAVCTIDSSGVVDSISIISAGSGYSFAIAQFLINSGVKNITVTNGGSGYDPNNPPTVTISIPDAADGIQATGTATVTLSGEISGVVITEDGSGYENPPTVTFSGSGGATATAAIETGSGATASIGLGDPDITSGLDQWAVEQAASDSAGQIDRIEMISAGLNYIDGDVTITISGDGSGATAIPVIDNNGQITDITITNAGSNYTFAEVTITQGSGTGSGAQTRAIIAPLNGHGDNMVRELYSTTIAIVTALSDSDNSDLLLNNDFRQIGLMKNLKQYSDVNQQFTNTTGTASFVVELDSQSELDKYDVDDGVTSSSGGEFYVSQTRNGDGYFLHLQPVKGTVTAATSLSNTTQGGSTATANIVAVTAPEFSIKTGELVYYENRGTIGRQEDQAETIKAFITF